MTTEPDGPTASPKASTPPAGRAHWEIRTTGTSQFGKSTVLQGERVRVRANGTTASTRYLCANCDTRFQSGSRLTAFCSLDCRSQAGVIRAFRAAFATYGRNSLPEDVEQALRIQMAHALSGGYDSVARYLPRAARLAIIERDGGLCVRCHSPGTEIDHIDGDSSDPTNLRLLCHTCHVGVTMSHHRHIDPRTEPQIDALFERLTERIDRDAPSRASDAPDWAKVWRTWVLEHATG